jgi:carboxylesterase
MEILRGAEPFYYAGGDVGCLCLHGLTAAPDEVRWLGMHLAQQGFTVLGPRLAGHGVDHRLLRRMTWQDWYLSALDGYQLLRQQCRSVFVAGLSMGGLLTLKLAESEPVDGVAVLAAPVRLPAMGQLYLSRWTKWVRPYYYRPDTSDFPQRVLDEQRRRGTVDCGRLRYDYWATQVFDQLYRLMREVDAGLDRITAPTLLVYSENDKTVPVNNLGYLLDRLPHAQTLRLTRSGHVLTQDVEYTTVLDATAEFFKQVKQ